MTMGACWGDMPDGSPAISLTGILTASDVTSLSFSTWVCDHRLSPDRVRHAIEQGVVKWGIQLVAHQWHHMTRFKAWPVCGEWEVSQAHRQWLAGLPDGWRRHYDADLARVGGMDWVSVAASRAHAMTLSWCVGDITGSIQSVSLVQSLLQWASSSMVVQLGVFGQDPELLMGSGYRVTYQGQVVSVCEEEWVRTPGMRVAVPASISDGYMMVRSAAVSGIYDIKWALPPDPPASSTPGAWGGYRLRERAWGHAPKDRTSRLGDMTALILAHEWGHARVHHHLLPIELATFAEAVCAHVPEVEVILEWWAELVPADRWEGGVAPMTGMVNGGALAALCEWGPQVGADRFWMYWSDTWFFDTPHRYMDAYSWGMACVMAQALSPGQPGIDWARWADGLWGEEGLYTPFVTWALDTLTALKTWVRSHLGASLDLCRTDGTYASYRQAWQQLLDDGLRGQDGWQGPRPNLGVIQADWCRRLQIHWPAVQGPDDLLPLIDHA